MSLSDHCNFVTIRNGDEPRLPQPINRPRVGAAVSMWASKCVATLLNGLEPRDPATLIGAAVALATVGALAG